MKRLILAAIFIIGMSACGNNNSTSSQQLTLPSQDIRGTYALSSVNGSFLDSTGIYSFDDKNTITGNLIINDNTWNDTYLADGIIYTRGDGTYNVVYNVGTTEGTISVLYSDGISSYNFTIDGYDLVLTGTPNATWTKTSDLWFYCITEYETSYNKSLEIERVPQGAFLACSVISYAN